MDRGAISTSALRDHGVEEAIAGIYEARSADATLERR